MKSKPVDPETFITEETISWKSPSDAVEQRLGDFTGKHQYEVCLVETYLRTNKYFSEHPEIDEDERTQHSFSLKAAILNYCIPHKLDWKGLLDNSRGHLVIKPDYQLHQYYSFRFCLIN
jgi:hypothetical protein